VVRTEVKRHLESHPATRKECVERDYWIHPFIGREEVWSDYSVKKPDKIESGKVEHGTTVRTSALAGVKILYN